MQSLVTFALTFVTAITICVFAEPKDVSKPRVPSPRIPLPPPSLETNRPTDTGDKPALFGGFDIFYSPYRLLNIEKNYYPKPVPENYMERPKMIWITKEIEHLNHMRGNQDQGIEDGFRFPEGMRHINAQRNYASKEQLEMSYDYGNPSNHKSQKKLPKPAYDKENEVDKTAKNYKAKLVDEAFEKKQKKFATTPLNDEFFIVEPTADYTVMEEEGMHFMMRRRGDQLSERTGTAKSDPGFEDLRKLRQNPNKGKSASTEDLLSIVSLPRPSLRSQIPVSLIPIQQQKLKLLQRTHADNKARARTALAVGADIEAVPEDTEDPPNSLYAIAIFTAMGAGFSLLIISIALGWYTLSKKAKAASDVDYPAYGVTGPSADSSGDRRLAQSAHMYHYQHQKQQIIAMERGGTDDRNGSMSDPESEDDNEEGDYTVYECPGYATTGDMEVKNPLFSDDPTPATPAAATATSGANPSPTIIVDTE